MVCYDIVAVHIVYVVNCKIQPWFSHVKEEEEGKSHRKQMLLSSLSSCKILIIDIIRSAALATVKNERSYNFLWSKSNYKGLKDQTLFSYYLAERFFGYLFHWWKWEAKKKLTTSLHFWIITHVLGYFLTQPPTL